jgi:hypothetical protein
MKLNFKTLAIALAAGTLLSACSEPPEVAAYAAKRPDVAPYMGADNGFMTKGWKPGDQQAQSGSI